jgi:glycyl-tRNA synthetase beta chain
MPQLLLELFSEEIPARMQKRAEEDLARLMLEKLPGFAPKVRTFSTPRRLVIVLDDLPARTPDVREERKGPRVGAPEKAIEGFLRSAGLTSIDQAQVQSDGKGEFYVAMIERKGRETAALVAEIVPEIVRNFPWPKSMRSGESDLTWVRPLQNICCVFDGRAILTDVEGVPSRAETRGHRFHAPDAFPVTGFEDYAAGLKRAHVVLDREERKAIILAEARRLCAAKGLALVEDAGLLEEVAGLVEWAVPLLGEMDPAFLDLPGEVIRLTMRTHQKYFAVRDPGTEKLAPFFVTVANIAAKDGGAAIAAGNARVLSARLNDARYFWDVDRFYDPIAKTKAKPLDAPEREAKLREIVFHQKLGSVWDKVERVRALAVELCGVTGADVELVMRAATLAKMDLVSETVGEFPELQGQIGRELAALQGENASVAAAIEDHYRPLGPNDRVPSDPVAITLALADKLDTLVGFWAIDEKPTGSSDAYGLRRAALGFVRIVLTNGIRFTAPSPLAGEGREGGVGVTAANAGGSTPTPNPSPQGGGGSGLSSLVQRHRHGPVQAATRIPFAPLGPSVVTRLEREHVFHASSETLQQRFEVHDLLAFLADRLKVQLREQGKRHDLVDAVFALGDDDLVRIVARVEALSAFLATDDGANLLAGYKRAANILKAEERKDDALAAALQSGELWISLGADSFSEAVDKSLFEAVSAARARAESAVAKEDFTAAMAALAPLRAPVDKFFETVMVNDPDPMLRRNRLALLSGFRAALHAVADFSKIEG